MDKPIKQFFVTGTKRDGTFSSPELPLESCATFPEALQEAREWHEQFGDAYAIWYRDRLIGTYDVRGHVPLSPEFR